MISLRKFALALGTLTLLCTFFIFHEGANSALDESVQRAQQHIDRLTNSNSASSEVPGTPSEGAKTPDDVPVAPPVVVDTRENATFFTLCRNEDIVHMKQAIRSVETKFNSRFHYDWVFLNDEEFTDDFKSGISETVSGKAHFAKIDPKVWTYPEGTDLNKAAETREWLKDHDVVYGDLESYHHMCRFQATSFYKHPLMQKYRYAWRVEPGISILCRLKDDPFRLMRVNEMTYGFNIAPKDIPESIPTLWEKTKVFMEEHSEFINRDNLLSFISDDGGNTYNFCHFWTNFEITDLDWLRSEPYEKYVDYLDKAGGFYYERWGDAPIRSIAAAMFLPRDKIHFFNDIGYYHAPYGHCPYNQGPLELDCDCQPNAGDVSHRFYDYHKDSCMRRYFQAKGRIFLDQNPNEN